MRITIFVISAIIFIALVAGKKSYDLKKEYNLIPISKKQWPIKSYQANESHTVKQTYFTTLPSMGSFYTVNLNYNF